MKQSLYPCLILFFCTLGLHAQCPVFITCQDTDTLRTADHSVNDSLLWKAPAYFFSPALSSADLFETEVALGIAAIDTCGAAGISLRYTLLFDLNGDGVQETGLRSDSTLPPGVLVFDNLGPADGDTLAFDRRTGVADSLRFRFVLETRASGDTLSGAVKWASGATLHTPQLPAGTHRIIWEVTQGTEVRECTYFFEVRDGAPPVLNCIPYKWVDLGHPAYEGVAELDPTDFLVYAHDNITPDQLLEHGIRLALSGNGFPVDTSGNPVNTQTFTCNDAYDTWLVEIWVRDIAGNSQYCTVPVSVDETTGLYCGDPTILGACSQTALGLPVEAVWMEINGTSSFLPPFFEEGYTNVNGCIFFIGDIPIAGNFTISPLREDNPHNGVSTYDLVLISRHILGAEPFDSPYKIIAGDANRSGSLTNFDILELRKLILGIYQILPNAPSWRFVDKNFQFPNPYNPFQTPFPETIERTNWLGYPSYFDFIGIKVGDVNNSVQPNAQAAAPPRAPFVLLVPPMHLAPGEVAEIPVHLSADAEWPGFQLHLAYDPALVSIENIKSEVLPGFGAENWAQPAPGKLTLSWSDAEALRLLPQAPLITLRVRAHVAGTLSERLFSDPRSEAYSEDGEVIPLVFMAETEKNTAAIHVFPVQPHPVRSNAVLPVYSGEPVPEARLDLRNSGGQSCWNADYDLQEGLHHLEIPEAAMPAPGLYFWTFRAGTFQLSGKLVKR
ncbi:MAG: hypothetical protein SFV22_16710 [Saprospiraceae bacterium]|nr:hypothetical protein [Saprospiraceae bacterium]